MTMEIKILILVMKRIINYQIIKVSKYNRWSQERLIEVNFNVFYKEEKMILENVTYRN